MFLVTAKYAFILVVILDNKVNHAWAKKLLLHVQNTYLTALLISTFFVKTQIHIYTNRNTTHIYEKAFESFQVNTMYVFLFHKGFFFSPPFFRINKIQRSKFISAVVLLTYLGYTKTRKAILHKAYHKNLLLTIQRDNLQRVVCKQSLQISMEPFSSFREAELHIRQYSHF